MTILRDILGRKKKEIGGLPRFDVAPMPRHSLASAVMSKRPSLIAEIKPVSPGRGRLIEERDIPAMVDVYQLHAQAISVLCDKASFGGGFPLLASVRHRTDMPILAKDFVQGPRQIDAAAFHGADAVLLIASILTKEKLREFAVHAIGLGLDVLLELHTAEDIEAAALLMESLTREQRTRMLLGINNRDLLTQTIDLQTTERLATLLHLRGLGAFPLVSESGISAPDDIKRLSPHVQGFLIGSAILTADDPDTFLQSLFPSVMKPKVKFCGMTQSGDIALSEKLCVDFIGFVFAPSSPRAVSLEKAKALRSHVRRAKVVGVFTDHPVDQIEKHAAALQLDFVQLHGEPDIEKVRAISVPVIQAFRGVPEIGVLRAFLGGCPYVLIDKAEGDDQADLSAIAALPADIRSKLFLAGGLTPSNVKTASDTVRPFAVDTARGIESCPGIKDHRHMSAFFRSLS